MDLFLRGQLSSCLRRLQWSVACDALRYLDRCFHQDGLIEGLDGELPRRVSAACGGKTKTGRERTRGQIKVLRISYLLFRVTLELFETAIRLTSSRRWKTENKYGMQRVINPDEGAMLFSRGKLCRVNPGSARSVK